MGNDNETDEENEDTASGPPTGGSGRGGTLGTPSHDLDEAPPSTDQEANAVVSGGGLVGPEDGDPSGNDGNPSDKAEA